VRNTPCLAVALIILLSFFPHPSPALDAADAAAADPAALAEDDVDPIDKLQEVGVNAGA